MDVTASFLAGALLSWAMPIALLLAVVAWYTRILRRHSGGDT
jgi:hypothetical protein